MPVYVPAPNIFDKFLKRIGKTRGVIIPPDAHEYHGKEKHIDCKKENLLISVGRPRHQDLPEDRADIFLLQKIYRNPMMKDK